MNGGKKQKRKPHPKEIANLFSKLSFYYILKLFKKGFQKELKNKDLYEPPSNLESKKLGDQLERHLVKQNNGEKTITLLRLLWNSYGWYYFRIGFFNAIINTALMMIPPYGLEKLVAYFSHGQKELQKEDAHFYAIVIIGFSVVGCIYRNNFFLFLTGFGIKVRVSLCSIIYRKVLRLNRDHLGDISIGKIVTLITRDVQIFEIFVYLGNELWVSAIRVIVACCMLYNKVGVATMAPVVLYVIIIPMQIYFGIKIYQLKTQTCKESDKRLYLVQQVLSSIRTIKMYTWEKFFAAKISKARKKEVHAAYKICFLKLFGYNIGVMNTNLATYVLFMTYVWLGNNITPEVTYFTLSCFDLISRSLNYLLPFAIYQSGEIIAATQRIEKFLNATEVEPDDQEYENQSKPKINVDHLAIAFNGKFILQDINLELENKLNIITGPLGSGKSVFLNTLLRECKPTRGNLMVQGNISYASQEPWLFPSSIRQNILFGEKYDHKRYQEVLKVCALLYDFELFEAGDLTFVEDGGMNLSKGQQVRINLARAIYRNSDIYLLDDCLSALDAHVSSFIFKECIIKFLKDKLVIFVSHNTKFIQNGDKVIILQGGNAKLEFNENKALSSVNIDSENKNALICNSNEETETAEDMKLMLENSIDHRVYQEENKIGEVDLKVYKEYIKLGGGFFKFMLIVFVCVMSQIVTSYIDKIINSWVNLEEQISNYSLTDSFNSTEIKELENKRNTIRNTYTFMILATAVVNITRSFIFLFFCRTVSIRLHKKLVAAVINAHMRFFDSTCIGNILNRFSKDFTAIDELIPFILNDVFWIFLRLTGMIVLIAYVNTIFLIPTAIIVVISVMFRKFCIPTTRSLKRLEIATRSSVVGYINATFEGLTTIRASKNENQLENEFADHLNLQTSAYFTFCCTMTTFLYVLETFCNIYTAIIITVFLTTDDETILAGDVGLALSQAFKLTRYLQYGLEQWTTMENQMTSVERVLQYTEIKEENRRGSVLENWPKMGKIEYKNVYLSYDEKSEPILKNINFVVAPEEKIAIVGRTGAGKSSIISALFRFYETKGTITIDGVDIKTLSLEFLRLKISIIPQNPIVFPGTIRDNIDPNGLLTDEEVWNSIEASNLKRFVSTLDLDITSSAFSFSAGQKQLLCLARAIAFNNKIIVLDEATADLDPETEALIDEVIQKNFVSCTIIIIAHKLNYVLGNCDRVIVLSRGEIIEYGSPTDLLANERGIFNQIVQESGIIKAQRNVSR